MKFHKLKMGKKKGINFSFDVSQGGDTISMATHIQIFKCHSSVRFLECQTLQKHINHAGVMENKPVADRNSNKFIIGLSWTMRKKTY